MSASNVVKNTAAAAVLAVAISMAFAAMAYADEPAGKAIESDAITGVTSSDIAWGDAAASSAEAEDTRMILRAPGSGVDYSGYKLTVGLFDDGGNQVGGNYEVAYNGGPTTVEGLDPSKVYTARVLGLVDADGNDALADFDNAVEESEKLVTGAEQEVWTKADALKPGMKGIALMFEHEGKTYMLGVDASNNVIAREATFENGVPTNVGDKFKWDTEPALYDSVALSISGEDNYLVMNYNGPAMHPANQFYNYEFAAVNGALRGNGNYRIFIKLGSGGTVGYDYASGTPFATWQSSKVAPTTKTVTFNITSTPLAKYTVKWLNDDGTELEVDAGLKRGETPSYDGAEPTKAADAQYTYTFAGWDAPIAPVTGDATYKATFNRTLRTYTVTWANEDGTVIETDAGVPYGTTPSFDSAEPTKAEDDTYTYAFAGWDTAVAPVTGDVTYKATFKATAKPSKPGKPGDQKDPQNKPSKAKTDKGSKKAMDKESKSSDSKKTGRATMPKTGDATDIALPMGAALAAGAAGYVALRRKNRNDA